MTGTVQATFVDANTTKTTVQMTMPMGQNSDEHDDAVDRELQGGGLRQRAAVGDAAEAGRFRLAWNAAHRVLCPSTVRLSWPQAAKMSRPRGWRR